MTHLDIAVLRRYLDEPDALLSYEKQHLLQCARCRHNLDELRVNAETAARALSVDDEEPDMAAARAAIMSRATSVGERSTLRPVARSKKSEPWRWFAVAAAAAAFALMFSYAPFRVYAQSLLTIFEPREVTPISLTQADVAQMRSVPELRELGTVDVTGDNRFKRFPSLVAAKQFAQEMVLRPMYLPPSVPRTAEYEASPRHTVRFTFDARKAQANAAHKHMTLPPPPPGVDGSTLIVDVRSAVVQSYGVPLGQIHNERTRHEDPFPRQGVIVIQAPAPAVRSTSLSASTIISYLLSLPNVPDDVKAQIRAIRDPGSTLPIPIAEDKGTSRPITIGGAQGVLIGDNTGVGSVIVWVSHGIIYDVAGGYSADEMMRVANSLSP